MDTPPIIRAIDIAGSQAKLAASSKGVSQQAIGKFASGKAKPRGETVIAISRATDWRVTPHELRPDIYPHPDDGLPEHLRGRSKEVAA